LQERNIRLVAEGKTVIDYLIGHSVIVSVGRDMYSFRMSGLFEYFLAVYMDRNNEFRDMIINDPKCYQAFRNEIELYSGIKKNDIEMLKTLYRVLGELKKQVIEKYDHTYEYEELIKKENRKLTEIMKIAEYFKDSIEPLSFDEQDTLNDQNKPLQDSNPQIPVKTSEAVTHYSEYMDCIYVLGIVFRNMDDINDKEFLQRVFRFLLDESCLSVYYVVGEFIRENSDQEFDDSQVKEFEKFIISFAPLLAHSVLFEMVSHPTISNLIRMEIERLSTEDNKDVKLFVLYFLLVETNLKEELDIIEELIEKVMYWNVHNSIFFKLLTLIAFKANGDKNLQRKLRKYLGLVYKKMYPKRDVNDISSMVSDLKLKGYAELPPGTFQY
jgi:6-pyruvoyl-tetrahydropterin synthase